MIHHHTKTKGDMGVGMVIADLMKNGIGICLPVSEHLPFDLVAVSPAGKVCRLQVKYKSMKAGGIGFNLRSSYADRNGTHIIFVNRSLFDAYAIYCPETNKVYYVRNQEIPDKLSAEFKLRIEASRNNQLAGVHMACDYEGANRLFE